MPFVELLLFDEEYNRLKADTTFWGNMYVECGNLGIAEDKPRRPAVLSPKALSDWASNYAGARYVVIVPLPTVIDHEVLELEKILIRAAREGWPVYDL